MPIIEGLDQGSSEWHDFRAAHLMATDIPVILGSNPFKSKLELWEEKLKLRPPVQMNDAMRRGQELEPIARQMAIEKLGMNFTPAVYQSNKHHWMAASLDGISDCGKFILEIKCPSKEKLYTQMEQGFIPEYYVDQMQHQWKTVEGVELVIYGVYFPLRKENPILFKYIDPDLEKQSQIIEKGREFYIQMCTMQPPVEWQFKERKCGST